MSSCEGSFAIFCGFLQGYCRVEIQGFRVMGFRGFGFRFRSETAAEGVIRGVQKIQGALFYGPGSTDPRVH